MKLYKDPLPEWNVEDRLEADAMSAAIKLEGDIIAAYREDLSPTRIYPRSNDDVWNECMVMGLSRITAQVLAYCYQIGEATQL